MARQPRYYHHGQSPAAWTGSIVAAVGFFIITVGVFMGPDWTVVWAGSGVVVLAALVTMIMKAMGWGQP